MRKTIILSTMLAMSLSSWAQNAVISGKFHKLLPNGREVDRVILSKPEEGELPGIMPILKARHDQTFRSELQKEDMNTIRYVGVLDEQYPIYLKPGETLNLEAGDGAVVYSGKLSKENQVFADWFAMVRPLRTYGYTKNGYKLPSQGYVKILDSLNTPVSQFIKNIRTGNDAFDKQAKFLLTYAYKFDVILPAASGLNIGNRNEYPKLLLEVFNTEKFADANIWNFPLAYNYMLYFGFAKHIIYNGQQGMAGNLLIPEIANKELRAKFILLQAQKGTTNNLVKFLENNQQFMVTDPQRAKMKELLKKARVKVPGGEWIDFAYPDLKGKIHNLSDYRGKVVLIDVWATWCAPCIKEQPALEELEKSFEGKDVVFISISIDTDKAKWKEMVEAKKLSGLHLFSNNQGPIVKDYEVTEIPRFILFDKNGRTVDINAPRPSDPKLKSLIESKL